jgi:uncharacterized Zn-binding protein involved in type VI secretion
MPCAARLGDQIIHSQALPQAKQGWWGGLVKGAIIGAVIVAVSAVAVVATVGTGGLGAPFAIGAAAVIIGSALRYGQVGFHEGAQQGALQGARAGPIKTGSRNVFINGKAAALACLSLVACTQHGDGKKVAQGSATVALNGHRMARVGDGGECGFIIGEGSPNVFVGAPPASCHGLAVGSEIPQDLEDAVDTAGKIGGYMELVGGFVMGGPAILNAFKSLAGFASLAAVLGIGYGGSQLASDYAKQHGMSASNQMMFGDFGGLTASMLGGAAIAKGPGMFNGIKSGFGGLTEPGGMFGSPELAPAGGPRGFGVGGGPEIVPRPPGSPGMEAWNPPKNEPLQMSTSGGGSGSGGGTGSAVPMVEGNPVPTGVSPTRYEGLGRDPATGGTFRVNEADTALRVEGQEGVTLQRYTPPPGQKGDWIDPASGNVYDGCSPTKAPYFDQQMNNGGYNKSLLKHVDNPSVDRVVVDTHDLGLTPAEEARLDATLNSLTPAQQAKIVRVK